MKKNIFNLSFGFCVILTFVSLFYTDSSSAQTVSTPTVEFITSFQEPLFTSSFTSSTPEQTPTSVKYTFDILVPVTDNTDNNAEITYRPYAVTSTNITASSNIYTNTLSINLLSDSNFNTNQDNTITVASCFYDAQDIELGCSKKYRFLYTLVDKSSILTSKTTNLLNPGEFNVITTYNLLSNGSLPSAWFYKVYPAASPFLSNINKDTLLDQNAHIECDNNSFSGEVDRCTDTEDPLVTNETLSGSFSHTLNNNAGIATFITGDYIIRPCFTTKTAFPYSIGETDEFIFNDFVCGNTFNIEKQTDNTTLTFVNPLVITIADFKVPSNNTGFVPTVEFNISGGTSPTTPALSTITYELYKCDTIVDPNALEFTPDDCSNPTHVTITEEHQTDPSQVSLVTVINPSFAFKPLQHELFGLEDGAYYKIKLIAHDAQENIVTLKDSNSQEYAEVVFKYQNFVPPIVDPLYTFFKEKNPVKILNNGLLTFTGSLLNFNFDINYLSDAYFEIIEDPGSEYFETPNFVNPFSAEAESLGIIKKIHKNVTLSTNTPTTKTFSTSLSQEDIDTLGLTTGNTYYYRLVFESSERGESNSPYSINVSNTSPKKYPDNRWFGSDFSYITNPTTTYFLPEKFVYNIDTVAPTARFTMLDGEQEVFNTQSRTVVLVSNEGLESDTISTDDFMVNGARIESITPAHDAQGYVTKILIKLTLTEDTPATISLSNNAEITDLAGNLLPTTIENNLSDIIYTLKKPVITLQLSEASAHNTQAFTLTSSLELTQTPQHSDFTIIPSSISITDNGSITCTPESTTPEFIYACVFTPSSLNTSDSSFSIGIPAHKLTATTGNTSETIEPITTPIFDITTPTIFAKSLQVLDIPNKSAIYTIQFSEPIDRNTITPSDFSFVSDDTNQTVLGTIRSITLNEDTTIATVTVSITRDGSALLTFSENSSITDPSGNKVTQTLSGLPPVTLDITKPVLSSINSTLAHNIITTTFTTSEPVTGTLNLLASDFALATSTFLPETISIDPLSISIVSSTSFTISTTAISGKGTARITLKNSGMAKITDAALNPLSTALPTQTSVSIDTIPPILQSFSMSIGSNETPTSLSLLFSEPVTGVTASNLGLTPQSGLSLSGTTSVAPESGFSEVFTFYPQMSGSGTLTSELINLQSITDSFGNILSTPVISITRSDIIDLLAPSIISKNASYVSSGSATITFTASEAIANSRVASNYDINYSGITATRGTITYNTLTHTVTIPFTNITGNGTITVSFSENSNIKDFSNNTLSFGEPIELHIDTIEPVHPQITVGESSQNQATFIVTFNEEVTDFSSLDLHASCVSPTICSTVTITKTGTGTYLITVPLLGAGGPTSVSLETSESFSVGDLSGNILSTESKSFITPRPITSTTTIVNPVANSGGSGGTITDNSLSPQNTPNQQNQGLILGLTTQRAPKPPATKKKKVVKKITPLYVSASFKPGTLGTAACPSIIKLQITNKSGNVIDTLKKISKITSRKYTGSSLKLKEGEIYNTQLIVTSCKGNIIPQPLNYSTAQSNINLKKINK